VITEWEGAYLDFGSLKYYLLYLKNVYERHHHEFFRFHQSHIQILPLEEETRRNVEDSVRFIESVLKLGREKVQQFIRYKSSEIIYLWEELLEVIAENESSGREEHDLYEKRTDMKLLIRIIYGNIDYLQQFIALNRKIEACLATVLPSYLLPLAPDYRPPAADDHPSPNINLTPSPSLDQDPRGSMSDEIRPEGASEGKRSFVS
jgi:hypothetical protein